MKIFNDNNCGWIDYSNPRTNIKILETDLHFASQLFNIQSAKRMIKEAQKEKDTAKENIYYDRLDTANHLADSYKSEIQDIFSQTFGA